MIEDIQLVFSLYPMAFYAVILVLGLIVGSFLNVVIYRLPVMLEKEWKAEYQAYFESGDNATEVKQQERFNLAFPPSTCPSCGHRITALENIPVISWLLLKAKCKSCRAPIHWRYPMVELLTAFTSLVVAVSYGVSWETLFLLIFCWSLIALTFIDLDTMLLPDQITLPLMWLGLLVNTQDMFTESHSALWGAALGYLILWGIYWAFKLLTGKEGMGYGDFKLLAALGAWLGVSSLPVIVILSSLVGAIFGIAQILLSKRKESQPIPFGPYLAIAGVIALFYGDWLINQYWQLILS
jgi:leader peptidase (prepilin peptidase) / N-methyltransferase